MFKKILLLAMVLILGLLTVAPVQAAGNIKVLSTSAEVSFPQSITFKISAQDDVNIQEVRLQYSIQMASFAQVVNEAFVQIQPSTKVDTQWQWDLTKIGGLPPGTVITYQWLLKDDGGNTFQTPSTKVKFDDGRY